MQTGFIYLAERRRVSEDGTGCGATPGHQHEEIFARYVGNSGLDVLLRLAQSGKGCFLIASLQISSPCAGRLVIASRMKHPLFGRDAHG